MLPSKASFGDGLGARVVTCCSLSVAAYLAAVTSFGSYTLIPSGIQGIALLLTVDGEKESAGSGIQLSLTNVGHPYDILQDIDVIVHHYLQSGRIALAVRVGDCVTAGQGVHAGQLATIVSQLVHHCCAYVKPRAVPLLHIDVLPDSVPPCPVDEHVSVSQTILTVSALLSAASSMYIHSVISASSWLTSQSSLLTSCTLFCRGYPHRMLLLLQFFRIASLHESGVYVVRWKSFDPAPARLILSWSFAVGSSS